MMYAFDLLELDGKDLRDLPLGDRKKQLRRLVGKRRARRRSSLSFAIAPRRASGI
jgi:ATP-dependent DNA ligase